ncbi:MAG: helix-turn-helix transcriptional regulator [Acidaminococcus sp.]|uniref:helix-turn-helix transcriptional regulator n=1 Tax=Acidaminococcus sp. TaxID=1872103 RepID=UPI002A765CD2|nr:helix-turn-helix transcriptional regulator [Acidaminococcus sp.]MDY2740100.1 helix-turn-helix transcriptional regulator [Acidaminococcus sp.]
MDPIPLSDRQKKIAEIVRRSGPITGTEIAGELGLTRAALRSDLAILTMGGILDARPRVGYFYTGKSTLGMLVEELSSITVEDIMSVPIVVSASKSAYDAVITMFLEDVGTLFVVDGKGCLFGVISRKDLLKASLSQGADLRNLPLAMVMTGLSKIVLSNPHEPAAAAARRLIEREVDCLPVVLPFGEKTGKWKLVGRVSKTNMTRLLAELAEGKGGNYHS